MKTLSIRQPWAELIVSGLKDIENRDWPTRYRGEILVHASKTFDKESFDFLQNELGLFPGKTKSDFQLGGIVGKTTIVDCVSNSKSKWFIGKFGFVLENSQRLDFSPVKGQLNFFEVDYHAK
ncbi:ASCH domain-containing protein [Leptospira levettii]|uniref:ASCH domain-containing protein n=1 Tax=Leptospira levettii TaxID=2023178 RepID=UPI000C29DD4A|nr:ASCH domain-containing protein [Leptospira levettii]PJZ89519.1 hypothetical protein CH368_06055 [Leptospira levettii]